jgi:hypothetical protein
VHEISRDEDQKKEEDTGELTGGLGREVEVPTEEIDGEGRSSDSVSLVRRCRGEEKLRGAMRGRKGALGAFYMVEGQVKRRGEAVARWAPLMVVGKLSGAVSKGEGEGQRTGAPLRICAHSKGGEETRERRGQRRLGRLRRGAAMGGCRAAGGRGSASQAGPTCRRARERGRVGVGRRWLLGRNRSCGPLRK